MKNFRLLAFVLIAIFVSATFKSNAQSCTECKTTNCSKVSVSVTYSGKTIYTNNAVPWVQYMNVTVALSNANASGSALTWGTDQYCPYGSFVNAINGIPQQNSYYWMLYINGQPAQFGIDLQTVKPNDSISFVYTSYNDTKKQDLQKSNVAAASVKSKSKNKKGNKVSHQTLYFTHIEESMKK